MKKILLALMITIISSSANADFFGGNNGEWKMGPYGPYWDESNWPEWTPMYWMDEFFNNDDDNNNNFYRPNIMMPNYGNQAMPMSYSGIRQAPMMPMYLPNVAPIPTK